MRRTIGLIIAGLMLVAGFFAVTGIPAIAGGSGPDVASAATPPQQIGLKILLINDNSDGGAAAGDWINTFNREGVPYTEVTTNPSSVGSVALPALSSTASNGTEVANYEGVVVALSGNSGLSAAQWATLQTFEQHFSVRQVTANAVPGPDNGLNAPANGGDSVLPPATALSLTADGTSAFPYLKGISLDSAYTTYGAESTLATNPSTNTGGGTTDPLVSGPGNSVMVGLYTTPDGRQTMFQTFNMGPGYLQSELLRHGELAWLARNTYFGDQRNYLETHVDDNFLADDSWCATATGCGTAEAPVPDHTTDYTPAHALREGPPDVTQAQTWSASHGNFRIDMLYNGGGSSQWAADHGGTDTLLTAFKASKSSFGWINHTWDHPNLDQGCAPVAYIESEITDNNNFATGTNANQLGLTQATAPTQALGYNNPNVVVTGEHSGLANLIPGNPGTVDPPEFDTPTSAAVDTGGLAVGTYDYAITDQFVSTGGESSASTTEIAVPAQVAPATGSSVTLSWEAVCHAADYKIYREVAGSNAWSLVNTIPATPADYEPAGPMPLNYTDTGGGAPSSAPPTANTAKETPYQQNTALTEAFGAAGSKITDFGSDASKPYPNPADASGTAFATASLPSNETPAAATFQDGGATAIPRYPTNIYYNVSTQAQEVDEFNTLYEAPPNGICDASITTCIAPPGWNFQQILDSIVGVNGAYVGMFQHMMGNDARPDYFHQTNMMGTPPASGAAGNSPAVGDGLYYSVMDELLNQYNAYFQSNAPIEQQTMAEIGTLLGEQNTWAAAKASQVTGSISGSTITVKNTGANVAMPLTGTTGGTAYAGSFSYWTPPSGSGTYTARTAWPAPPTVPAVTAPPTGSAPTIGGGITKPVTPGAPKIGTGSTGSTPKHVVAKPIAYAAVQVKPKTVSIKHGKVTVSLACKATKGKTAKNRLCAGSFTLTIAGHNLTHRFSFRSPRTHRFTVTLSTKVMAAAARTRRHHRHKMVGSLLIKTIQTHAKARRSHGALTIRV